MQYIQGEARNQGSLFPVSLEELVPDDHLVGVIEAYVGRLDLGVMGFGKVQPRKTGRPSYDPADLLKLYPQTMAVWQRPLNHAPFSGARSEMSLAVQAYNLKRAINVLGARRVIELLA